MTKIYWSYCDTALQVRANAPIPIMSSYFKDQDIIENGLEYIRCPAFKDYFHNTFGIQSLFDYDINFDDYVHSTKYDQEFFEKMVNVRNEKSKFASFNQQYIFIAETDSLKMECLPSMLENNSFNKTAILIPAVLDIGQYVRSIECAFHCRTNTMQIKEKDIYSYVKFKTDDKIEFQRFLWTDSISQTIFDTVNGIKAYRKKTFKPLNWYYKKQQALKTKKRALKLIKENLL
jgi:hypothetical protein|tara:strand:+ start:1405 stop:2100 length:696 start_codon:yes stop_codon:yes gene_type:complete